MATIRPRGDLGVLAPAQIEFLGWLGGWDRWWGRPGRGRGAVAVCPLRRGLGLKFQGLLPSTKTGAPLRAPGARPSELKNSRGTKRLRVETTRFC